MCPAIRFDAGQTAAFSLTTDFRAATGALTQTWPSPFASACGAVVADRSRPHDDGAGLRRLRGKIGGLALAAQRDPKEYTRAGRAAFLSRFEEEADPDGVLPPAERARRAEAARRLHFTKLAYLSAKTRAGLRRP